MLHSAQDRVAAETSLTIPSHLTTVESKCFESATSLTTLELPGTVTTLEDYAFFQSGLRTFTIPASVTYMGTYLFWGASIQDITIQASVPSIPSYAFVGSGLKRLVITGDVSTIPGSTFTECRSLTSVTLPASLTSIDSFAFWGSDNIADVYFAEDINQWANIKVGSQNGSLTTATLHLAEKVAGFSDVTTIDYYASAVKWAKEIGVTSGTSDTTFSPKNTVTRAEAVTFLWKAAGRPEPTSSTSPFVDVTDPTAYSYKPILWAAEQGITSGVDATHFGGDISLSYDQILTFLCRAAGGTITDDWSQSAQNWAKANGLTDGISFAAKAGCPRADVVYFLWKQMK